MEDQGRRLRRNSSSSSSSSSIIDVCDDDVLSNIFRCIRRPTERNAISAVCKRFHELEAKTRTHVLVYNMYTACPTSLFQRFPSVTSITMKGNPRLVDFELLPREWAGHAGPWIDAIKANPQLNRFRIKRMMITDSQIEELCAACGRKLQELIFDKCTGFSSKGLESIAKYCKNLTNLGLAQCTFDDSTVWLRNLAESCVSLKVLDLSLVELGEVEDEVVIKLARRCQTLRLWETQNHEHIRLVLQNCTPNLSDLGILRIRVGETGTEKCTGLQALSGIFDLVDGGMESLSRVSSHLKKLDLSYSGLNELEIAEVLEACPNLEQLRVCNSAGDFGLQLLGRSCRRLSRLVVESASPADDRVTHLGLMAVAQGCRNLQKLIFYPSFITNEALQTLAYNCPNLMDVRISLMSTELTAQLEWEPNLDAGVGALVQRCQNLHRLTLTLDAPTDSPLLTDEGMSYIGKYGSKIRVLTLVRCGSSDDGLVSVLSGCSKLQRLELRRCPFGDKSMLEVAFNDQLHLKSLFMQGCEVTSEGLNSLAYRARTTASNFYVEVIGCKKPECLEEHREQCEDPACDEVHRYTVGSCAHWQILAYHSLTEPRTDRQWFIERVQADHEPRLLELIDEEDVVQAGIDLNDEPDPISMSTAAAAAAAAATTTTTPQFLLPLDSGWLGLPFMQAEGAY